MVQLAPHPLEIAVTRRGEAAVIKPSGSADMFEAGRLRDQLAGLLAQDVAIIVVDLSETDFVGYDGLSAMVCGHLRARARQGELRLAAPRRAVLGVLEVTKLTEVLPVYRSVEEALAV